MKTAGSENPRRRVLQEKLEREYYLSLSDEERAEQEAWAKLSTEHFFRSFGHG
jgi:hypothetical protein